jgi:hypothetical protein
MDSTNDTNLRILTQFFKAHILYVGMVVFIIVLTYMTVNAKKVSDNWEKTNNSITAELLK